MPFTFASSLVSESLEQARGAAIRENNKYNMLSIRKKNQIGGEYREYFMESAGVRYLRTSC